MTIVNGPHADIGYSPPAVAAGDLAATYTADHAWLAQLFRRRGVPAHEADDLAQETVVRTLTHLKRHGRRPGHLRPLMRTIAHNLLVERVRRSAPVAVSWSDGFDLADPHPGPEDTMVASERVAAVRRAVRSLSPRHRLAVRLWMSGRTPAEISRELGINRNAADAILHRARRRLAVKLEGRIAGVAVPAIFMRLRAKARRLADAIGALDPGPALAQGAGMVAMLSAATALSLSAPQTTADGGASGYAEPPAAVQERSGLPGTAFDDGSIYAHEASEPASLLDDSTVVVDLRNQHGQIGGSRTGPDGESHFLGVEWEIERGDGERGVTETVVDGVSEAACDGLPSMCDRLSGR